MRYTVHAIVSLGLFFYFQRCSMNGQLKNRKLLCYYYYLYLGLSERWQALSYNTNLCLTNWCRQLAMQTCEHTPTHTQQPNSWQDINKSQS